MATPKNKYLFNFASSYSGGGKRILLSYLNHFEKNGGSFFILNVRLKAELSKRFRNSTLIYVNPSRIERLLKDGSYLSKIKEDYGTFDFYFSYGIPIYMKMGKKNWFHVSNLIPISPKSNFLRKTDMIKMYILRSRLKKFSKNIDVISADSNFALSLSVSTLKLSGKRILKKALKNGLCQDHLDKKNLYQKENFAVTVGTQPYKDLESLEKIFLQLREENEVDRLKIIGDPRGIPKKLFNNKDIEIMGNIPHSDVVEVLSRAKVFISTSLIENSSIASLEGAYFCEESYLSKIGPHKEMLEDLDIPLKEVNFSENLTLYKISAEDEVSRAKLELYNWDSLTNEFNDFLEGIL